MDHPPKNSISFLLCGGGRRNSNDATNNKEEGKCFTPFLILVISDALILRGSAPKTSKMMPEMLGDDAGSS